MRDYLYSIITDNRRGLTVSIIKFFLSCLSLIYSEMLRIILACYKLKIFKTHKLPVKVISIGNITLGGTGKTPLVELIVSYLIKNGHKVAILTRGYKRNKNTCDNMGDEPYLLKQKLGVPVIVDSNRRRGAEFAKNKFDVDTVVLDDGFQQFSICKDLDILTIDAANPFGNFIAIPRGILREPISSIQRADIIVVTKVNLVSPQDLNQVIKTVLRFNNRALILELDYSLNIPSSFNNVCVVTSIASPGSFKKLVIGSGINIISEFSFCDHYCFKQADIDRIISECKKNCVKTILTTEKDWARLSLFKTMFDNAGLEVIALPLKIKIRDEERLYSRVSALYLDKNAK